MKASYKLTYPEQLEATVTITTSVREFKTLLGQIPNNGVFYDLRKVMDEAIKDAEKTFTADSKQTSNN